MNSYEKMKTMNENRAKRFSGKSFSRYDNIFYTFEDGDNIIRLVGVFKKVKTHFIAPAKGNKQGTCISDVFVNKKLAKVVNCPDWDNEKERDVEPSERKCPICKMHWAARKELKERALEINIERKKYLESIQTRTRPSISFKWNIIDRRDPYIYKTEDCVKTKMKGFKIVNLSMEAWKDLENIFNQLSIDIADEEKGIDIDVVKGHNGIRTTYKVQAVMEGMKVKETPLTEEELEMEKHDLKRITSKKTDADILTDNLVKDLKEYYLSLNEPKKDYNMFEDDANNTDNSSDAEPEASDDSDDEPENTTSEENYGGDIQCFGQADENHPECKQCNYLEKCVEKRDSK